MKTKFPKSDLFIFRSLFSFPTPIILTLILLCLSCFKDSDDLIRPQITFELSEDMKALLPDLNKNLYQLTTDQLVLKDKHLPIFDDLSETSVVGLGESTHGTKEFFEMKHRVFQYLVEHHGFKVFAFEMDFAESLFFN